MKSIKFFGHNKVFAKNQEEYKELPVYAKNGIITACFQLTEDEVRAIAETSVVFLTLWTFGSPAQPVSVRASRPNFPIPPDTQWMVNPQIWDKDFATYKIGVITLAKQEIIKEKQIWVSVVTYGSALQPIQPTITTT